MQIEVKNINLISTSTSSFFKIHQRLKFKKEQLLNERPTKITIFSRL